MRSAIATLGIALGLIGFDSTAFAQPGRGGPPPGHARGGPAHGGGRYYAPSYSHYRPVYGYPGGYGYRSVYPAYRYSYPGYSYGYPYRYGYSYPYSSYGYSYPYSGYGYGYPYGYGYGYPYSYGWNYGGINIGFYRPGFSLGFTIPVQW